MSIRVLPDGSVVIQRGDATVHFDHVGRALHLWTSVPPGAATGVLLASYSVEAIEDVRVTRNRDDWGGQIMLKKGDAIGIGRWSSRVEAEATASAVAELVSVPLSVHSTVDLSPSEEEAPFTPDPPDALEGPQEASSWTPEEGWSAGPDETSVVPSDSAAATGQPPAPRYFVPAPGRFPELPEWRGVRRATGAFVHAIALSVPPRPDGEAPPFVGTTPSRYFVPAPGHLVGPPEPDPAAADEAPGAEGARAIDWPLPPLDQLTDGDELSGPSFQETPLFGSAEVTTDPSGQHDEAGMRERSPLPPSMARLKAVVGPWHEPTPPPRFPPAPPERRAPSEPPDFPMLPGPAPISEDVYSPTYPADPFAEESPILGRPDPVDFAQRSDPVDFAQRSDPVDFAQRSDPVDFAQRSHPVELPGGAGSRPPLALETDPRAESEPQMLSRPPMVIPEPLEPVDPDAPELSVPRMTAPDEASGPDEPVEPPADLDDINEADWATSYYMAVERAKRSAERTAPTPDLTPPVRNIVPNIDEEVQDSDLDRDTLPAVRARPRPQTEVPTSSPPAILEFRGFKTTGRKTRSRCSFSFCSMERIHSASVRVRAPPRSSDCCRWQRRPCPKLRSDLAQPGL